MEDLAILSQRIIEDYPTYYGYFSMPEWNYDGRVPTNGNNRNPLLKLGIGADGLKTGHTSEAGYGLVGSAQQDGRRIVFVLSGLTSERERAEESERVVSWAFRQFVRKPLADSGVEIAKIPVWMGDSSEVGVSATEPVDVLVPLVASKELEMKVEFEGPVAAPISAGDRVAELVITGPEMEPRRVPLVADSDIGIGGPLVRIRAAAETLYREFAATDEGAAVN
jgi:D-alanyl-D-alanine carboxypeptidase (penicillin-binding protein 5/6)